MPLGCSVSVHGEALFVDNGRGPVLGAHKTVAVSAGKDILGHQFRFGSKAAWFLSAVTLSLCLGSFEMSLGPNSGSQLQFLGKCCIA